MAFTFKQTPAVATKSNVPTIMSATQANAAKTPIPAVANTLPRTATPAATPTIYSAAQANKATTPMPTPTAAKPATDPFASYGGKDNYSAKQNERYAQAYSANDTGLMGRLIADSQRAGYSLNTPKPANATPTAGQTTPYVAPTYNVLDYNTALGQAYGQLDPTYQQAVQAAQQQGYTNQLDAGELASARGGAHSGLAADLQNKVNINTQNEISKLAAERMAKAAEMAQQLVQRSQDNAYRDKTFDRDVFTSDRTFNADENQRSKDNTYRDDYFGWQKTTDTRNFNADETQRAKDNRYRDDTFSWEKETNNRDFTVSEDQRAKDNQYRDNAFAHTKEQDKLSQENFMLQFNEQVKQNGVQAAISWANNALAQDDNARGWASLDYEMQNSGGDKYSGLSANQVFSAAESQFKDPNTGKVPTDTATKEAIYKQVGSSGLPVGQDDQVMVMLGLSKEEIAAFDKKYGVSSGK